jgi:hypothetical protein
MRSFAEVSEDINLNYRIETRYVMKSKETGELSFEVHHQGCDGIYRIDCICDLPLGEFLRYYDPIAVVVKVN